MASEGEFSPGLKFVERFNRLRKINKFTDCSFKIENRVLSCHKLILSAASPVFEAMLYSQFAEGSEYAANSIKIPDVSFDSFSVFINYIYTGELALPEDGLQMDRLMDLAYCAQKYLIDDLRKQCVKKLSEFLNNSTVLDILGKSFDRHLEDFLVSCLYFIADALEAGESYCNVIMNNEESHLSPQCFEFLIKNLLDYLGERDDLLCLIKAWALVESQTEQTPFSDESQNSALSKLNIDNVLSEKIHQLKSSFAASSAVRVPRSFHRVYYKPVRPLIISRHETAFDVNISFKRFVIVNSLMINSRLIPLECDISNANQTYTENLQVEIFEKASNQSVYKQNHTIDNVSFNAFFQIKFNDSIVLFPSHVYVIKISWSEEAIGFEYPRCVFSLLEKGIEGKRDMKGMPLSIVQFHENGYSINLPFGSIVQGISYDLLS